MEQIINTISDLGEQPAEKISRFELEITFKWWSEDGSFNLMGFPGLQFDCL